MPSQPVSSLWPALPYAAWKDTCATRQLWTQVVGKIRLARTPWLNHSWHVALKPGRVTVAGKPSDDLAPGTRNSIMKQAGLKEQR